MHILKKPPHPSNNTDQLTHIERLNKTRTPTITNTNTQHLKNNTTKDEHHPQRQIGMRITQHHPKIETIHLKHDDVTNNSIEILVGIKQVERHLGIANGAALEVRCQG